MVYTISRQSRDAERMRQMTETKRLYYEDVYKKEFTAKSPGVQRKPKKAFISFWMRVLLPGGRRTASDTGYLNDVKSKGSA